MMNSEEKTLSQTLGNGRHHVAAAPTGCRLKSKGDGHIIFISAAAAYPSSMLISFIRSC